MSGLPNISASSPAPAVASRGKIIMMAIIAGAVITNIYATQPILPLISSGLGIDLTTVDLVAGAALLGVAFGLAFLLPLGDRFDRRKLVLGQIAVAFIRPGGGVCARHLGADRCFFWPWRRQLRAPATCTLRRGDVAAGRAWAFGRHRGQRHHGWHPAWSHNQRRGWGSLGMARGLRRGSSVHDPGVYRCGDAPAAGVPTTTLSYGKLLASLWPLARDNRPIRESMMVQALLWACFNAFWVNLAALLSDGPWHLGSAWAGGFGIIGAAGALAASLGGRATDRLGSRTVIGASIGIVTLAFLLLAGAQTSIIFLVIGVIVLDIGVQSGLVSNQTRAFAVDPKAQGRINSLYMTATFLGGALGVTISGWLMTRYGWPGIVVFGIALGLIALAIHWLGAPRRQASADVGVR